MDGWRIGSEEGGGGRLTRVGGCSEWWGSGEVVWDGEDWRSWVDGESSSDSESVLMSPLVSSSSTDLLDFGDSQRNGDLESREAEKIDVSFER